MEVPFIVTVPENWGNDTTRCKVLIMAEYFVNISDSHIFI